jgi:hypothetical protein
MWKGVFVVFALNSLTNLVDGVRTTRYTYTAVSQVLSEYGQWSDDTFGCACKFMKSR